MTQQTPFISVVSPVYGCESCLYQLVDGIEAAFKEIGCQGEIILVDDASPDNAWEVIKDVAATHPGVLGIRHSRNFGQHAAIMTGLEQVRGDWVVVMDCDLQDPPSAIPALYRKAVDDQLDSVFGQRVERQDSAPKRLSSWVFHRTLSWLTGVNHDGKSANFGIFSRPVIDAVVAMPERTKAFPLMVKWVGFDLGYLPVQHAPRASGQSGYTFSKMIALARSVALSYSDKPLRMVATAGSICSLIAFAFALGTILLFFKGEIGVAGYTSAMFAVWLLGGITLFSLGVVGLYVGQVFENVQGRPSSITREVTGDIEGHAANVRFRTVAYLEADDGRPRGTAAAPWQAGELRLRKSVVEPSEPPSR